MPSGLLKENVIEEGVTKTKTKETEAMLLAAQEHALRTNSIKAKIDKQTVSSKCRLCGTKEETVMHLVKWLPQAETVQKKT